MKRERDRPCGHRTPRTAVCSMREKRRGTKRAPPSGTVYHGRQSSVAKSPAKHTAVPHHRQACELRRKPTPCSGSETAHSRGRVRRQRATRTDAHTKSGSSARPLRRRLHPSQSRASATHVDNFLAPDAQHISEGNADRGLQPATAGRRSGGGGNLQSGRCKRGRRRRFERESAYAQSVSRGGNVVISAPVKEWSRQSSASAPGTASTADPLGWVPEATARR